jgi:hypothetical protein
MQAGGVEALAVAVAVAAPVPLAEGAPPGVLDAETPVQAIVTTVLSTECAPYKRV